MSNEYDYGLKSRIAEATRAGEAMAIAIRCGVPGEYAEWHVGTGEVDYHLQSAWGGAGSILNAYQSTYEGGRLNWALYRSLKPKGTSA